MKKEKIPIIEANGANYNAGYKIGQICRKKITKLIETSKKRYSSITGQPFEHFVQRSKKLLAPCQRRYAKYIDEIRGITDGASVNFNEYFALNFEDEVADFTYKCTTLFLKTENNTLLGHNEDWTDDFVDKLYILKLKQKDKPSLLFLSYLGPPQFIISCINSAGIAFTGNSLYTTHKLGIPEAIMLRSMADASSVREAIKDMTARPREMGMNSMIISKNRIVDIENSLNKSAVIEVKGEYFVHTNHPLKLKGEHSRNSLFRFNRVTERLENSRKKNVELIKEILSDHKNYPDSVCRHIKNEEKEMKWATIASVIIDVGKMRMLVAQGNPCKSRYEEYKLD